MQIFKATSNFLMEVEIWANKPEGDDCDRPSKPLPWKLVQGPPPPSKSEILRPKKLLIHIFNQKNLNWAIVGFQKYHESTIKVSYPVRMGSKGVLIPANISNNIHLQLIELQFEVIRTCELGEKPKGLECYFSLVLRKMHML